MRLQYGLQAIQSLHIESIVNPIFQIRSWRKYTWHRHLPAAGADPSSMGPHERRPDLCHRCVIQRRAETIERRRSEDIDVY